MPDTMDDFLAPPTVEPDPAPEPVAEQITETPEPTDAPESAPAPEAEPDEPDAVETSQGRMVPLKAVQHSRQRARDAEKRATDAAEALAKAQGERDAFLRQIEALQKAPPAPVPVPVAPPAPPPEAPNPITHPQEYADWADARAEARAFSRRYASAVEDFLEANSRDDLDALIADWGKVETAHPELGQKLKDSNNPLSFAQKQIKRFKAMKEIGDDPVAWAEAQKTKWLAEQQSAAPAAPTPLPVVPSPVAPRPRVDPATIPASLAASRSATPRGEQTQPIDDFDGLFPKRG